MKYLDEQLFEACKIGTIEEIERLIKTGANVNAANDYGETALMWASLSGYTEIAKLLIKAGAKE